MFIAHPFLWNVMLVGVAMALLTAPLGCFVLWQRLHYVGDALAHATLLGVVLGVWLDIPVFIGVFALCALIAVATGWMQKSERFSTEGLIALSAYVALALSLVLISLFPEKFSSLLGFVFGDILAVNYRDIAWMMLGVLLVAVWCWRRFRAFTLFSIHPELAFVAGYSIRSLRIEFLLVLALSIAITIKVIGVLLMSALLIIPPHIGRIFAKNPGQMCVYTLIASLVSVLMGIMASLLYDVPTAPAIIVAAGGLFLLLSRVRRG